MILARKAFVHLLAVIMLLSLLGGVWSLGFSQNFGKPAELEKLLSDSKIYDKIVASALDESQQEGEQQGTDTSVSLNDNAIKQAAEDAFTPELLESSFNRFIEGNYAWLMGQTAKPDFSIDLTDAKKDFTQKVSDYVANRLKALPVCTPEQQAQLQIPVDPLTITCRPAALDPNTEGARIAQEITGSDFLSEPVITAETLGKDKNDQTVQPYYERFAQAPKLFRLAQKLPLILGALALVTALAIIAIAPERRRGVRRVGVVLALAGVILLITKFVGDWIVGKFEPKDQGSLINSSALDKPLSDFLHQAESQIMAYNLGFGVAFILLAIALFVYLYKTREGQPKTSRITEVPRPPATDTQTPAQPVDSRNITLAPRSGASPTTSTPTGSKPTKPKRPRLIQ